MARELLPALVGIGLIVLVLRTMVVRIRREDEKNAGADDQS